MKTKADKLETKIAELEKRIRQLEEVVVSILSLDENTTLPSKDAKDDYLERAIDIIGRCEYVSPSLLQRTLSIGYERASYLLHRLEEDGYIGPEEKSHLHKVLKVSKRRLDN
ncbi:MAG: DNA translocase FtsK [bacterium]|nr:DNA translocase FtsK [bacterium]